MAGQRAAQHAKRQRRAGALAKRHAEVQNRVLAHRGAEPRMARLGAAMGDEAVIEQGRFRAVERRDSRRADVAVEQHRDAREPRRDHGAAKGGLLASAEGCEHVQRRKARMAGHAFGTYLPPLYTAESAAVVAENASVSTPGLGKRLLSGYLKLATYGLFRGDGTRRSVIEAQAVVSRLGASANVRIALELRTLDRNGQLQERRAIDDGSIYQALFARLDKSLFLQREGL